MKKKNMSFVSNEQLLSLRFKSQQSSKSLSRNKSIETNISLIQKKNYENSSSSLLNVSCQNTNPNSSINSRRESKQKKVEKVEKEDKGGVIQFLRKNITNKVVLSEAQKVIQGIPDQANGGITKQQAALMAKIQQLYLQKTKMKKQKRTLQHKLKQISQKNEQKYQALAKQNERLHKIILKQSQMLASQPISQAPTPVDLTEDLRRFLVTQAKQIQQIQYSNMRKYR